MYSCLQVTASPQKSNSAANLTNPDQFLKAIGRRRKVTLGDGNCFFRALSYIVFGDQDHHQQIRSHLSEFIHLNAHILQRFVWEGTMEQHVSRMRNLGTWATQVELAATATFFQIPVFSCSPHPATGEYQWLLIRPLTDDRTYPVVESSLRSIISVSHIELCNTSATHFDCIVCQEDGTLPTTAPVLSTPHLFIDIADD